MESHFLEPGKALLMLLQSWRQRLTSAFCAPTSSQTWRRPQRQLPHRGSRVESLEPRIVLAAPNVELSALLPANAGNGSTGTTIFGTDAFDQIGRTCVPMTA